MFIKYLPMAIALGAIGCSNDNSQSVGGGTSGNNGNGGGGGVIIPISGTGSGGSGGGTGVSVDPAGELTIVVRDFKFWDANDPQHTNPDFENVPATDGSGNPVPANTYWGDWDDRDIVTNTLGSDFKPVYSSASGTTLTTHGKAAFDQWFNTVDGTNIMKEIPMTLTKQADGTFQYWSETAGPPLSPNGGFFPIDDGTPYATPFGNQGEDGNGVSHNFSFTVEIHTVFTYTGGEKFTFKGDDDVFVYINNRLVINRGGIHGAEEQTAELDSLKVFGTGETITLTKGNTYPLDFFYAERHVVASDLKITTALGLTTNTDIPIF